VTAAGAALPFAACAALPFAAGGRSLIRSGSKLFTSEDMA
jgi:hypothetical protein